MWQFSLSVPSVFCAVAWMAASCSSCL